MSTTDSKRRPRVKVSPGVYYRETVDGGKVFQITYRDSDGRQRWETIAGGRRDAERALDDRKSRKHKGERVAPRNLTFNEASRLWLDASRSGIRPATLRTYESSLNVHLLPELGRRKLSSITVDDLASLIDAMRTGRRADGRPYVGTYRHVKAGNKPPHKPGEPYKGWTIQAALTVARSVFAFAARRLDWPGRNPVDLLHRSERPKPRADQRSRRTLDGGEIDALLVAADGQHALIFELAISTGARLGEVLGLRWRSIDFERGTAEISDQLERGGTSAPTKTGTGVRTIELPLPLLAKLRRHRQSSDYSGAAEFVFANRDGGGLDHRNIGGRALARAVKAAGLAEPAPTFHDFRHTFASAWLASGGDIVELSGHLGHKDSSITMSTYAHEYDRSRRSEERRERIAGMYGRANSGVNSADPQSPALTESRADSRLSAVQDG